MGLIPFDLYDFIRGPAFVFSFAVFAVGIVFRVVHFIGMTRRAEKTGRIPSAEHADSVILGQKTKRVEIFARFRLKARHTMYGTTPIMGTVSTAFHLLLFLCPLLLPAHNILMKQAVGISLFTLPEPLIDTLTLLVLAACGFFLLRRIIFKRVRCLTSVVDYLILFLVASPFATAYLAYHQYFNYRTVLFLHMIVGELVIMAIPFTKLGHMPFVLLSRFLVSSEYGWGRGFRRW